jgi:8-oxo-dGTP pyrophosphatase MutT (NUDIX family)
MKNRLKFSSYKAATSHESVIMELCDVLDETGTPTGQIVARGTILPPGEYYQVVQVWVRNEAGQYLIQQRAQHVSSPGVWAITAGYVVAGEASLAAAIRETHEELGIQLAPAHLTRFERLRTDDRIEDVWLADVIQADIGVPAPSDEVADWKWASRAEISQMISAGVFFGYSYFARIPE